ncbi:hypothetical protein BTHER_10314 [Brochothrix thermosphacta DSM 20171 = FSL F6-1036]|nr:hypothetical protein BTHER_10314 [Brochothrix thermosphacta DSM 20171 = FSL F6-1036]
MNQRERMIAGLPYIANKDASLVKERDELKNKKYISIINYYPRNVRSYRKGSKLFLVIRAKRLQSNNRFAVITVQIFR